MLRGTLRERLRLHRVRKSHADELREIGRRTGCFGLRVDQTARFEFAKRKAAVDKAALIQQFVAFAIKQYPPVPRRSLSARRAHIGDANIGSAVISNCIVKFGVFVEPVKGVSSIRRKWRTPAVAIW